MSKRKIITIRNFVNHAIKREYMAGVNRSKTRVKATGEVFTPDDLVSEILQKLQEYNPTAFTNEKETFLDPTCGDGQFLIHVMLMKLIKGDLSKLQDEEFINRDVTEEFKIHLRTIYGTDLMKDNVSQTHKRISMGLRGEIEKIVKHNIRCENALTYDFSFE